jgi:hypothetical protein
MCEGQFTGPDIAWMTRIFHEIPQNLGLDIMDIHEHCLTMSNTNPGDVDQPMVGTTHTLSTCW